MKYRLLGNSDLKVSEISLGCMSLPTDQDRVTTLLDKAVELGINFFDTADLYQKGINEEEVGNALKGKRDRVIIATKVGNQWRKDGSGWDWNPRKAYILKAIHESLRRLKTDYLDLYQLHGGTIEDPIDETIEAFETLVQKGLIRYYGISSIRPNVIRQYVERSNISSVMMQYSLLDRRPEESCFSLLRENNIGVIVRGALASGLLVDKPPEFYLNYNKKEVILAKIAVHELSNDARSPAQTAIQFCLSHPAVTTVAAGASKLEQLRENAKAAQAAGLSEYELAHLAGAIPLHYYEKHR